MWVKFENSSSSESVIVLPKSFSESYSHIDSVRFSSIGSSVGIEFSSQIPDTHGNSFEQPQTLLISKPLKDKLLLPLNLVYQIILKENTLVIGPVIGMLLGNQNHRYSPKHMQKYSDRFGVYNKIGGLIYAFSPSSVHYSQNRVYGLYYNIFKAKWSYGCFPLPEVVYRRDFHTETTGIKRLMAATKGRLFNSTRLTKMDLYELLSDHPDFHDYLPETQRVTDFEQIRDFIFRNGKSILKPVDLSRGRGICIIEKSEDCYQINDYRQKTPTISLLPADDFEDFIHKNNGFMHNYLIQKFLSLAQIRRSLFDIRVVMQKKPSGDWFCGGIECRVSGDNIEVTNISRGGYALTLDEALKLSFSGGQGQIKENIMKCCNTFCRIMDETGEHFAEFGIDIAVDTEKRIWLIEANVFPSFKGFKAIDKKTYLAIRYAPMLYAASLTDFGAASITES